MHGRLTNLLPACDAPAVHDLATGSALTYAQLHAEIDDRCRRLGPHRRLTTLAMGNDLDSLVWYLACLAGGHPVIVTDADDVAGAERLASRFGAAITITDGTIEHHGPATADSELHDALAVLLSTSGSTGSPRLVRLSHRNLVSNAAAIVDYLELDSADRAITTLPPHYCYGLSVIHSHLVAGATVVLSDLSVIDPCFWDAIDRFGVTGFAGVPHTFDLLEQVGLTAERARSLRYLTQAGGRMPADQVRRFGTLGRAQGWDLFVMYGQTEATARMAFLPPAAVLDHPGAIGDAIPGGTLLLRDDDGRTIDDDLVDGNLWYRGPNVMMGYAEERADLARGHEIDELDTGDIARRLPSGFYAVVGRRSRFLKLFGNRIDLTMLESRAADAGHAVICAGDDQRLVVARSSAAAEHGSMTGSGSMTGLGSVAEWMAEAAGVPPSTVTVVDYPELPRLPSGKPDYPRIRADGESLAIAADGRDDSSVAALFRSVLGRDRVEPADSYVSLGGDSLAYIEMSVALERLLDDVPTDWHLLPVGELDSLRVAPARAAQAKTTPAGTSPAPTPPPSTSMTATIETDVALRAIAIVLIVASHFEIIALLGGAHVLLAVAGYNLARFHLPALERSDSPFPLVAASLRLAAPTLAWTALVAFAAPTSLPHFLLVSNFTPSLEVSAKYWFVEVLVQLLLGLAVVLAVAPVRRWVVANPWSAGLVLLAGGLVLRFGLHGLWPVEPYDAKLPTFLVWILALGWLCRHAVTRGRRVTVTVMATPLVVTLFDSDVRNGIILGGILALLWVRRVPVVRWARPALALLASTSLYTYLTHFHIARLVEFAGPHVQTAAALLGGVAIGVLGQRLVSTGERHLRRLSQRTVSGSDRELA